jgi:hypothetical protein
VETKRRFNNLVHASGLIDKLQQVKARPATVKELCRFAYLLDVAAASTLLGKLTGENYASCDLNLRSEPYSQRLAVG